MSRRDVIKYYNDCQSQYFELLRDSKDFDDAVKAGLIDQSQYEQAQTMLNTVKNNYERLSYIIFLLNSPNKSKKKAKYNKQHKNIVDFFDDVKASQEYIKLENDEALTKFRQYVDSVKKG